MKTTSVSQLLILLLFLFFSDALHASQLKSNCTDNATSSLSLSGAPFDLSCNAASGAPDGAIDIEVGGGQAPYLYFWTTNSGDGLVPDEEDQTNLKAGTYTVVVYDANGASISDSWTLIEPTAVAVLAVAWDLTCNSVSGMCDGSISLTPSGGTKGAAPIEYTFNWTASNGGVIPTGQEDDEDLTGLCAGTYAVVITDANNCTLSASYTLTEPTAVTVIGSSSHSDCNAGSGAANGAIEISASEGTPPYSYLWSTTNGSGLAPTNQNQIGLGEGDYSVTVYDSNGCTVTDSWTIYEPEALKIESTVQELSCASSELGSISISVSGGKSPYAYLWSTSDGDDLSNQYLEPELTDLGPGTYTVVVIDANGCTVTDSWWMMPLVGFSTNGLIDQLCNCVDLDIDGGEAPYDIQWETSDGGNFIQGSLQQESLEAGTYHLSITDTNGCTHTQSMVFDDAPFEEEDIIHIRVDKTNPTCADVPNGEIKVAVCGGVPPYIYEWSSLDGNGLLIDEEDQEELTAGEYLLHVTDQQGTSAERVVVLNNVEVMSLSAAIHEGCYENNNGSSNGNGQIDLTVDGGKGPYSYAWYVVTGDSTSLIGQEQNKNLADLKSGLYGVMVTDKHGCQAIDSFEVTMNPEIVVTAQLTDPGCNSASGAGNGKIDITVLGGVAPFTFAWSTSAGSGLAATDEDQTGLNGGTYRSYITSADGCTVYYDWELVEPTPVAITGILTNLSCNSHNGIADGTIDITISGGTSEQHGWPNQITDDYTTAWTTSDGSGVGATDRDQEGLSAGTYTVVATDKNGCTVTDHWTLTEPTELIAVASPTNISCNGNTGAIDATVSGGTAPYVYNWYTADGSGLDDTSEDQSGLTAGTYFLTVSDANGCMVEENWQINKNDSLKIEAEILENLCEAEAIEIRAQGGSAPYVVSWVSSNGGNLDQSAQVILNEGGAAVFSSNFPEGAYTFTIVDKDNCTTSLETSLENPSSGVSITNALVSNIDCYPVNGNFTGSIDISVEGDHPPYAFSWTGPNGMHSTEMNLTALSAGVYKVTVTDALGCSDTEMFSITSPQAIVVGSTIKEPTGNGANGSIDLHVTGGATPYFYLWNNGSTTKKLEGLSSGVYWAKVTDSNGCEMIEQFILTSQLKEQSELAVGGNITGDNTINNRSESDLEVTIYPNPAYDVLNIVLTQSNNQSVAITLYDVNGKIIGSIRHFDSDDFIISEDVSQLQDGLYFLEVVSNMDRQIRKVYLAR